MSPADLSALYLEYIACLNQQDWAALGRFVDDEVSHNGRQIGLLGYRDMLERDFREIPDLRFSVALLVAEPPHVAHVLLEGGAAAERRNPCWISSSAAAAPRRGSAAERRETL